MVKPLPPLNAVRAFEAASRHLNLSRAAEELGVTQGAISKQVIALEDFIGVQLFVREPGGLRLTNEGGSLKEAIAPAFTTLSEAFSRYSRRSPRSNVVRISTTASFASQFIVPRLQLFRDNFPDIDLEFITTIRLVDLAREEFDIAVRAGPVGRCCLHASLRSGAAASLHAAGAGARRRYAAWPPYQCEAHPVCGT
jgi:LysR family glycine cleavage system transcriptional activator